MNYGKMKASTYLPAVEVEEATEEEDAAAEALPTPPAPLVAGLPEFRVWRMSGMESELGRRII